ncbi:hypothetical protein [Marinilabilia salmonicolor]|jgi:tetratricopeptide (TPR) repeat protein|uniref:Uncharacterized protein n=1 Tax=Marinilabilia salmonicolor TaxID=989 RepID=A0A2T0XDE9_9BACT|nr:hypothetical protein [Marinilabilia salmonicolor]PRY96943.1 hypothetical protein BY457_11316 [Marinilabilia salmonicolor]RCW36645.1 hypothetical protein DFO77_10887 [Marinilabilia salmonicolor]
MRRLITSLLLLTAFLMAATPQKVRKEKVEIQFETTPLVKLKTQPKTFGSNAFHLNLGGLERTNSSPDLIVLNNVYPAAKLSNWWLEDPTSIDAGQRYDKSFYTQPYTTTVKDKDGNIIFHRVYSVFEAESGEPVNGTLRSELSVQLHQARELSYLFSPNYVPKFDIKLFYIKKSDNHDDINSAVEDAKRAIELHNNKEYEKAKPEFEKALNKWMAALDEKDLSDKNARINESVTKGLYQNVIQILAILGNFEEAEEIKTTASEEIGGFYNLALNGHNFLTDNLKMITKGNNGASNFKFVDLEYDESVKPMIEGENRMKPDSPNDIRNLLTGSWRFMCITTDNLPASIEDFDPTNRPENLLGDVRDRILHLNPDGTSIEQRGSWEEGDEQIMDRGFSGFWRFAPGPKNKFYLMFGTEEEDFENIQENYDYFEVMDVWYINDKKMILKITNYNPDMDGYGFYVQLQRIPMVM